jgi:hypothetical protein
VAVRRDTTAPARPDFKDLALIEDRTFKVVQIVVGMLPILAGYPFPQRYFVSVPWEA